MLEIGNGQPETAVRSSRRGATGDLMQPRRYRVDVHLETSDLFGLMYWLIRMHGKFRRIRVHIERV